MAASNPWTGGAASSAPNTSALWGATAAAKTAKERGGVVGFFEHFGEDFKNAAVGLPMGLVNTVEHPIRTAKTMATSTWQTWSPLVHGDFGKFGHNFVEHPLAPILDIASIASLGLGGAAKIAETGIAGENLAKLATRNELKVGSELDASAPTMTRALSRRAGSRFRQNIVHEITGRSHPFMSDQALYKKLSAREASRQQWALNARMASLAKAYKDLQDPEMQSTLLQHIYNQIRTGPARAVKVKSLVNGKAPKGWRFVQEHTQENQHVLFDPRVDGSQISRAAKRNAPIGGEVHVRAPKGHVFVENASGTSWRLRKAEIIDKHGTRPKPSQGATGAPVAAQVDPMMEAAAMQAKAMGDVAGAAKMFGVDEKALQAHIEGGGSEAYANKAFDNHDAGSGDMAAVDARSDAIRAARKRGDTAEVKRLLAEDKKRLAQEKSGAAGDTVKARYDEQGNLSVSGGYKNAAHEELHAPDGSVLVKTKNGYRLQVTHVAEDPKLAGRGFIKELQDAHGRFTTTDVRQAAIQRGGKEVLIVPEKAVRAYSQEAARSASFIRKIYDYPTRAWRAAVLNLRPAYVVNNGVGNMFMYMMNHGDMTGARAWLDTVKQVKGAKALDRIVGSEGKLPHWQETHFGDEVLGGGNTFADTTMEGFRGKNALAKAGRGVMPLNMKMERMFRKTLLNSEMRRAPEVQALMKKGMSFDEAASKALKADKTKGLRERVLQDAHNTLGDYHAMTKLDRHMRDLIPFWAWDKTIARHTAKAVEEQPTKVAIGANIGDQGTQSTENALGNIPSFMRGVIPLPGSWGKMDPGRKSILTTQGINPYATIPDLADSVMSLSGAGAKSPQEGLGAMIGPWPTIAIEGLTAQRASGAKIPRKKGLGPFGSAAYDTITNLPPSQLIAAATGNLPPSYTIDSRTGAKKGKLYQKDWESVVSSWLGVPTRKEDPAAADAMFQKELKALNGDTGRKKKKPSIALTWGG